jgi:hypothetical protein
MLLFTLEFVHCSAQVLMVSKGDNCLVANTFVRISVGDLPSLSHHVLQILQIRGRGIIKNSAMVLFGWFL